jgi:hypothetical protein
MKKTKAEKIKAALGFRISCVKGEKSFKMKNKNLMISYSDVLTALLHDTVYTLYIVN